MIYREGENQEDGRKQRMDFATGSISSKLAFRSYQALVRSESLSAEPRRPAKPFFSFIKVIFAPRNLNDCVGGEPGWTQNFNIEFWRDQRRCWGVLWNVECGASSSEFILRALIQPQQGFEIQASRPILRFRSLRRDPHLLTDEYLTPGRRCGWHFNLNQLSSHF